MHRFTYKASEATLGLAAVQKKLALARKRVRELEAEELGLKGFLVPYYNEGELVDVEYPDGTVVQVSRAEFERFDVDDEAVKAFYAKHNRPVPYKKTTINKFTAKLLGRIMKGSKT